jgi:hypothetical protein
MSDNILSRTAWRAVVTLGIALIPVPAQAMTKLAQAGGDLEVRAAKAAAILGAPSRLSIILAEQQGLPSPTAINFA